MACSVRQRFLALVLLTLGLVLAGRALAEERPRVTFFFPTDRAAPEPEAIEDGPRSAGPLIFQFDSMPLSELGGTVKRLQPLLPDPAKASKPNTMEVPYYIEAGKSDAEKAQLIALAKLELQKGYPGVKIKVVPRELDPATLDPKTIAQELGSEFDSAAAANPGSKELAELAGISHEAATAALHDAQEAMKQGWFSKMLLKAGKSSSGRAFTRAASAAHVMLMGGAFGYTAWTGFNAVTHASPVGTALHAGIALSLMAFPAAVQYLNTRFQDRMVEIFARHPIPIPGMPEHVKRNYQHHWFAQYVKSVSSSILTFAVGRNSMLQILRHLNNGAEAPWSLGALGTWVKNAAVFTPLGYAGLLSHERLHEGGHLSRTQIDFLRKAGGTLDVMNVVLLTAMTAGHVSLAPLFILTQGGSALLSAWALAAGLSRQPRNDRPVLVEDRLRPLLDAHRARAGEETFEQARRRSEAEDKVQKNRDDQMESVRRMEGLASVVSAGPDNLDELIHRARQEDPLHPPVGQLHGLQRLGHCFWQLLATPL